MTSSHPARYDPNGLLDFLQAHLNAPDDHALAQALSLPSSLFGDLRAQRMPVSACLLLSLEASTGLSTESLRRAMGDRRANARVSIPPIREQGYAR
ncbi:MAG: hypothetical protein K0S28_360 [Paucimonas sp.]|jgi:hypothetical protein|nr:hypothetical protein [Paucimonas sp.]